MTKKIYVVTQESEDDGNTGVDVFATKVGAMRYVNARIDDHNEDLGCDTKLNHIIWPERLTFMRVEVGGYTYHLDEAFLGE